MATAVVITSDTALTGRLAAALEGTAMVAAAQPSPEAVALIVQELDPRVVFLDMENARLDQRPLVEVFAAIRKLRPGQHVIAIGDALAPGEILAALRAGADDYLARSATPDELRERSLIHLKAPSHPDAGQPGSVVMVLSGRPNDGESFVSMHLAASRALARRDRAETVLVDFNLPISECETAFNVTLTYTIADAVSDLSRLDRTLLASALSRDEATGLYFLPLAATAKSLTLPSASALVTLFDVLSSSFSDVVVNLGCLRHSDMLIELLPHASRLVVVTTQSLASIRCCGDVLRQLRGRGTAIEAGVLAVSEFYRGVEPDAERIAGVLELRRTVALPPDRALLLNSLNEGVLPILTHPRSAYARAIEALTVAVYDASARPRRAAPGSVRRFLRAWQGVAP